MSTIIIVLHTPSNNLFDLSTTYNLIYQFINKYSFIILLPLQNSFYRYSIKQLELMKIVINFFVYLNTYMKTYPLFIPDVYKFLKNKIFTILKGFSLLLWHGDDMETIGNLSSLFYNQNYICISRTTTTTTKSLYCDIKSGK